MNYSVNENHNLTPKGKRLNLEDLLERHSALEFQNQFSKIFIIYLYYNKAIKNSRFKPSKKFVDAVKLTKFGKDCFNLIQEEFSSESPENIKFTLLLFFYHYELLIDVMNTNHEELKNLLNSDILSGTIYFPYLDRILYDKYFDIFSENYSKLDYDQTEKLLKNTPKGVFQIKNLITGPLGLIESDYNRFFLPTDEVPSWHCPNISCSKLHLSELSSANLKFKNIYNFMISELNLKGESSEYEKFFFKIINYDSFFYNDFYITDLPNLLINSFADYEIKLIFIVLLKNYSKEVREKLPSYNRIHKIFSNSPENIVKELSKEECIQIILILSNEKIVDAIEFLIENKTISIPFYETRRSWVHIGPSVLKTFSELSRYGIRTISNKDLSNARLKRLIKTIFKDEADRSNLEWKLRHIKGGSILEKINNLVFEADPKKNIRDIIFFNKDTLKQTFEHLQYGRWYIPSNPKEEEYLCEKILWKLGYNIHTYPDEITIFWERLDRFLSSSQQYNSNTEFDREKIRAEGVNLFVSIEEILERSLSLCTWLLFSDHYRITKFEYEFENARIFMANTLNDYLQSKDKQLLFDIDGQNTLYPLVQGFTILSNICEDLLKNPEDYLCLKSDLPISYGKNLLMEFPFLHKNLLFDLEENEVERLIENLKFITNEIENAPVYQVRNGIDHKRLGFNFPQQEDIEKTCKTLKTVIEILETNGYYPLIYLIKNISVDKYSREKIIFEDYKKRTIKLFPPLFPLKIGRELLSKDIWIIIPSLHIKKINEFPRFFYKETSEYTKLWQNYPKKKRMNEQINQFEELVKIDKE